MNDLLFAFLISLGINALFFVAAASLKTDKVTDLSYSLSFIVIAAAVLIRSSSYDTGRLVVAGLVLLWGIRLASYLLSRIIKTKVDHRFDGIRESFFKFARFWLLQAITAWVVSLPVILYISGDFPRALGPFFVAFAIIALAALAFETVADAQKSAFYGKPAGRHFIQSGLWKYSRHPNYFGEALFWWALFATTVPALYGSFADILTVLLAAVGPMFITFLLLFVSGIPLLEKAANKKLGQDPEYVAYKMATSIFVPWPPKKT